jgi:hypothetical protein
MARRTLLDVALDMDTAFARAARLSAAHTERLGARAIDLLHVSNPNRQAAASLRRSLR